MTLPPPPTMVAGLWPMENCVPELSCTAARSRHDFPAIDPKTSSQAEELIPLPRHHLPKPFLMLSSAYCINGNLNKNFCSVQLHEKNR